MNVMNDKLTKYKVRLDTPQGEYLVEVPTFQGSTAAARRAFWAIVAAYNYDPGDVQIMEAVPLVAADGPAGELQALELQGGGA
jgi:hypothetical protein